jgi:hypothetical protein
MKILPALFLALTAALALPAPAFADNAKTDAPGTTAAKPKVTVHTPSSYKALGSHKSKTRIAILEPDSEQPDYSFFGKVTAGQITGELWSSLESSVLQTRRLSLLDRKTFKSSLDELHIINSALTGADEKAKLKNVRGADLILIPTIHKAEHVVSESTVQLTGQVDRHEATYADVEVRGIVPSTGEILFSKHYIVADASSREDAFAQVAADVTRDIAAVVSGRRASPNGSVTQRSPDTPVVIDPKDLPLEGPRESGGVKLPFDH